MADPLCSGSEVALHWSHEQSTDMDCGHLLAPVDGSKPVTTTTTTVVIQPPAPRATVEDRVIDLPRCVRLGITAENEHHRVDGALTSSFASRGPRQSCTESLRASRIQPDVAKAQARIELSDLYELSGTKARFRELGGSRLDFDSS